VFWHLILGLLRDGRSRHGYELMTEYASRSGNRTSAGNFYRELARLASKGLVETGVNPPDADARRIPYRIKQKGQQIFDRWLTAPTIEDGDLPTWVLFANQLDVDARNRILERHEETLWMRSKAVARMRDDLLARRSLDKDDPFDPLPVLLARQIKLLTCEIESLHDLRVEFEEWSRTQLPEPAPARPAAQRRRSSKS
jgi:DNA-binding PadR family transcriptional regulator